MTRIFDIYGNINPIVTDVNHLLSLCAENMEEKQKALVEQYHLDQMTGYRIDEENETLHIKIKDGEEHEFGVIPVGLWNSKENKWFWAWANGGMCEGFRRKAAALRKLKDVMNSDDFSNASLDADTSMAQTLSYLSVEWLGGIGRFIAPQEDYRIHFVIMHHRVK